MNMIAHEAESMHFKIVKLRSLLQEQQKPNPVLIIHENGPSIHPTE
jgi:hypothetical protein